ncbi:MAG: GTP cyclohydrolase I FolE [Flavobacteriales bacterium]|jgi:GTP cyclohydrolase I|nr:GTP cyclohydrolase I FolE [Flavobacteriales bacterium]
MNEEKYPKIKTEKLAESYLKILKDLGEDSEREGLEKTPERVAKSMQFLTSGYEQDPKEILLSAMFDEDYQDPVIVKEIEFYSLCEHHILPFFGKAHIAYIPDGKIVGLSKIPRIVEVFSRRLQVQERLTRQIKECIEEVLQPKGVAVVLEAQHMCMQMRGVESQKSITTTTAFSGKYAEDFMMKNEFLHLISLK